MSLRTAARRLRPFPRDAARWLALARGRAAREGIRLHYGVDRVPSLGEPVHGGLVKLQALAAAFGGPARDFNVLYLVSSTLPHDARMLLRLARRRGAKVVWNQNGVAYPGWHGPGWERVNAALARGLHAADHVVYQSEFCRLSADRFLGEPRASREILHNPVDAARFTPGAADARPTLLLGGNQYQRYRFEVAVETLALLPPEWRLLVTGRLSWLADERRSRAEGGAIVARAGVTGRVELAGAYTQADAPQLLRRAALLLHPKYNDPCPTIVLEALACGLPAVYSATGGTPELVGEAGIGIPAPLDWERDHPPRPAELAEAVLAAFARRAELGAAARARAARFALPAWLARHAEMFEALLAG